MIASCAGAPDGQAAAKNVPVLLRPEGIGTKMTAKARTIILLEVKITSGGVTPGIDRGNMMRIATLAVFGLVGFTLAAFSADESLLPFSMSVTKMQWARPAVYRARESRPGHGLPVLTPANGRRVLGAFLNGYRNDVHR